MSKIKYFVIVGIVLVLTVSVSFMSVGAASNYCTEVNIPTKNSITKVYIYGSSNTFKPEMFDITDTEYPYLAELGLQYGFDVPSNIANYFTDGRIALMADDFSEFYRSQAYSNLSNVTLSQYQYFTFTFICAVNDIGHTLERSFLNCGLTANYLPDTQLELRFEDVIVDDITMRCYTFGISSKDYSLSDPSGLSVATFLNSLELLIYPDTSVELLNSPFTIMLSDIRLRLYTANDILNNNIGSLEDAINKSNQEVVSKLDDLEDTISQGNQDIVDKLDKVEDAIIQGDVSVDNSDLNGINGAVGDLDDIEGAVTDATPEWDPSILTGVPDDLTGTLSFLGSKLMLIVDGPFGTVIFFCLTMGLCLTLIGRAVR